MPCGGCGRIGIGIIASARWQDEQEDRDDKGELEAGAQQHLGAPVNEANR